VSIQLATVLSGHPGQGGIETLTVPSFVYTGLDKVEELFAQEIKAHFLNYKAAGVLGTIPDVLPAYSITDRKFNCVIVEASVQQADGQGFNMNLDELEYNDEVYQRTSGNLTYNVDLYCRSANRQYLIRTADFVLAGLVGPLMMVLRGAGIVVQSNSIRFSGKITDVRDGPDAKDLTKSLTITVSGVILPWVVLYKQELPSIVDIKIQPTQEE